LTTDSFEPKAKEVWQRHKSMTESSKPVINPWIIAISVMLGTFMEVLDTTVVNVSLQHIAGSLSVTPEEATWVLTSYLVANAIVLPLTGWLGNYFGRRNILLMSVGGFTVFSFLCGIAPNLPLLIIFRIFQGATGARFSLLPPENATGNYVKVVQRIPVRIRFDKGQDSSHQLRPGMSAEPTVLTQ
jgi:hypothetical protein